jgi:cytidine deaminase
MSTPGGTICAERTAIVKAVVSIQLHYYIPASKHEQSDGVRTFIGLAVTT